MIEADCFEAITTAQIVEFVSGQVARRGLAPKTANRYREILTRLFNWAVEQKGVRLPGDRNPASKVERYRESAPNIRFLTLKQIDEQLGALADDLKLQTMVATLIFGGLRREELLWLTHDDLDLDAGKHGMIRVRAKEIGGEAWEPKTKRNRAVPVSSRLRHFLDKWHLKTEKAKDRGCFPAPKANDGTPTTSPRICARKSGREIAVGLPGFPPHVRQPTGDEGREPLQDQQTDGQLAGNLQSALRGTDSRRDGGFSGICRTGLGFSAKTKCVGMRNGTFKEQ